MDRLSSLSSQRFWCLGLLASIACKSPSQSGSAPAIASSVRGEAAIPQLTLASSRARAPVPAAGARVAITRTDLRWGSEAKSIAPLPGTDQWAHGFDAKQKRNGQSDLSIVALSRAVQAAGAREKDGRATVTVDTEVPYRILVEVLFTLGQEKIHHFDFVVANPAPATFSVDLPESAAADDAMAKLAADMERDLLGATGSATAGPNPATMPATSGKPSPAISRWTLRVSSTSVELRGPEAATCSVPRAAPAGIAACIAKVPPGADTLVVSAPADLRFQELVSTLDLVRGDDAPGGRFRTLHFALPR